MTILLSFSPYYNPPPPLAANHCASRLLSVACKYTFNEARKAFRLHNSAPGPFSFSAASSKIRLATAGFKGYPILEKVAMTFSRGLGTSNELAGTESRAPV